METNYSGRMPYCGNLSYDELEKIYIGTYAGLPGLTEHELRQSHRRWRTLGKKVKTATGAKYV